MRIRTVLALAAAVGTLGAFSAPVAAQNQVIPSAALEMEGMEHVANLPQAGGNNLAFFERLQADGTVKRYVVSSTKVNGFDIVDVTDPTSVSVAGRYILGDDPAAGEAAVTGSSLGVNYHPWVDVNPRRNLVALSIEDPAGVTVRHGTTGLILVDISDIANPKPLGKIDGLGGPHTLRMIDDTCIYTSLPARVIDYSDANNPQMGNLPVGMTGHEYWPDPNQPGLTWVGTEAPGRWAAWDTTDCRAPTLVTTHGDPSNLDTAHEAYPAPDGSYVGVADFTGSGQAQTRCPGGGIHFYDLSGRFKPGSSLQDPQRMGAYFANFDGTLPTTSGPNHASCTMHSYHMAPERELALGGLYTGGTWVFDPTRAPTPADGEHPQTTWGVTVGHVRDALDFVNATQWLPFDLADPEHERLIFTTGWERGIDVYKYTGPLPKKLADLSVSASAAGGAVTGMLERYPLLTHTGWESTPLAGQTVEVTAGGTTVQAVTAADGSFSASLGLGAGSHQVTVTWAGDDVFRGETTTRTVTA